MNNSVCYHYGGGGVTTLYRRIINQTYVTVQNAIKCKSLLVLVNLLLQQLHLASGLDNPDLSVVDIIQSQTCAVIAPVLQSLQTLQQQVQDLLPGPGSQEVEVGKDSTHDHSVFQINNSVYSVFSRRSPEPIAAQHLLSEAFSNKDFHSFFSSLKVFSKLSIKCIVVLSEDR